jgi:hypothetical protein
VAKNPCPSVVKKHKLCQSNPCLCSLHATRGCHAWLCSCSKIRAALADAESVSSLGLLTATIAYYRLMTPNTAFFRKKKDCLFFIAPTCLVEVRRRRKPSGRVALGSVRAYSGLFGPIRAYSGLFGSIRDPLPAHPGRHSTQIKGRVPPLLPN